MLNPRCKQTGSRRSGRYILIRRGELQCCLPIEDAAEVGRLTTLNQLAGLHPLLMGHMILHAHPRPVVNLLKALGTEDFPELPNLFLATRTTPKICLGIDEVIEIFAKDLDRENTETPSNRGNQLEGSGNLICQNLIVSNSTIPVIDVHTLVQQLAGIEGLDKILDSGSM